MSILWHVGLMLLGGLLFGRLSKLIGFPNVTGYIVAGLIMGPYILGLLPAEVIYDINLISEIALGFIALSIGAEFKLPFLKEIGITPIIIALLEGVLAAAFVVAGLIIFGFDLPLAIILGAIASATAPAVTIMIIRQYRANGPVTKTLIGVVALDDALALILFCFAVTGVKIMTTGIDNLLVSMLEPFIQLGVSALIGISFSLLMLVPLHFFKKESNRMCAIAGIVFAASSLSGFFGASSLLTCMILGTILVNISKSAIAVLDISEMMTPPIFMLFFVLSGASLDISLIPTVGIIGAIYIIMRVIGKVFGAWLGAVIMKTPRAVRKYLGWTLIPQAGVAIGLTLVAGEVLPGYAGQIRATILSATLIYELAGSVVSKFALTKAGEIDNFPTNK